MKALLILLAIVLLAGCAPVVTTSPIVSLDLGSSINGSFILGTGRIDGSFFYYVYVVREDGGLVLERFYRERVVLYEIRSGEGDPRIERTHIPGKYDWVDRVKIWMPAGSVTREYNADVNR